MKALLIQLLPAVPILGTILFLGSCGQLDVVAAKGLSSLEVIETLVPVTQDDKGWNLESPERTESFFIASDFSATSDDIILRLDISEFKNAGFLPETLGAFAPASWKIEEEGRILSLRFSVSDTKAGKGASIPRRFVKAHPERIGYHGQFDHYGFDAGGGFMLEWAGDKESNDKDLVFVLPPEAFLQAGLDPSKLQSWLYGTVTVMDANGKDLEVKKLLRVYNLE